MHYFAAHTAWFFAIRRCRTALSSRANRRERSVASRGRKPQGSATSGAKRDRRASMTAQQRIVRVRRNYNQWVANQTLEDYALRFTAKSARKWSSVARRQHRHRRGLLPGAGSDRRLDRASTTASSTRPRAILIVGALIFLTSLPIAYYAATYGVDIDLLTRGAGFGYIGSTITSLIYASFTFLFFAIEAAIMSLALEMCFGIPLFVGYVISSLVVIPLVTHGITLHQPSSRPWTQPFWLVLHLTAVRLHRLRRPRARSSDGRSFSRHRRGEQRRSFNLLLFGTASTVVFSLIAQIGEQVDFLRFLPRAPGKAGAGAGGPPICPPGRAGSCPACSRCWRARSSRSSRSSTWSRRRRRPSRRRCIWSRSIRVFVAAAGARVHRRLRHHFAAQDQRHQRLCRLDRVVELLLAPDPQPSRAASSGWSSTSPSRCC